jgi:hypothetical protein
VLAANTATIDVIRRLGFAVASRTEDGEDPYRTGTDGRILNV